MSTIFTIGYIGFQNAVFFDYLVQSKVRLLVDTREIPLSRKRGFSKSALSETLMQYGIDYLHLKALGSKRADRLDLHSTGDYSLFFSNTRRHLRSAEARAAIASVISLANDTTLCLMCCCQDWRKCHRSCIVESIKKTGGFEFNHLHVQETLPLFRKCG